MKEKLAKLFALTWFIALFGLALIEAQGCRTTSSIEGGSPADRGEAITDQGSDSLVSEDMSELSDAQGDAGDFDEPPGLIPATKYGPVMQQNSR